MKKIKTISISTLLTLALLLNIISASATSLYWSDVGTFTNTLEISDDGTATMTVFVRAYDHIDKVTGTAKLQKYANGSWSSVSTYSLSSTECYLYWGTTESSLDEGYNYRLQTITRVYENNVWKETITMTDEVYY